jgi:hypothetical protein
MTVPGGAIALRKPPPTDRRLTPELRPAPQAGDVVASKRSARADIFTISVVAGADDRRAKRYQEAIDRVRELARELRVDGWFTCDHTHYAHVAHFRRGVYRDKREVNEERDDASPMRFGTTPYHHDSSG